MYAAIYLTACKTHIVVPKKFIFGLSQQKLDNYGKNRNIPYLIFYSKEECENGSNQDDTVPKFNLAVSTHYPPDNNEACYTGHIKYFFGEYYLIP